MAESPEHDSNMRYTLRMQTFSNCAQLSQAFFTEYMTPVLQEQFPDVPYDAGLIGTGSEVLGYDDELSTDHDWRPRAYIFLSQNNADAMVEKMENVLRQMLPKTFQGFFAITEVTDDPRSRFVHSLQEYARRYFGIHMTSDLQPTQWLILPEQKLLGMTSGQVFHSGLGDLKKLRDYLSYYPHEVWLYLMACQWQRISQEEHFMGRSGSVGDELGSQIIATRLVRDIMRLAFLQERRYAPYIKWFGTAFSELSSALELLPHLRSVLSAKDWKTREKHLSKAYEVVARKHNDLSLTPKLPTTVSLFHNRPYLVIQAVNFAVALQKTIAEPSLKQLPLIGSVDQVSDNTDVLEKTNITTKLLEIYV